MNDFLNYTLFKNGVFILTTGSLVSVLLTFIIVRIGLLFLKRLLARFFKNRNIDIGRQEAIYKLTAYLIWTITAITSLEIIGIHITFLLAGSAALLVGLGLGLQQIFQDLVSGIFILIEGIIKVNDVIELDGMVGKILSINLRTSKMQTRDGIMIIVPNHKFIVEKITNWSHNSDSTRFKVDIGVAYGSDVAKVKDILLACAKNQSEIIQNKEAGHDPFVRFVDFGDSALKFELFFWTTSIFTVEFIKSNLRFDIDENFRNHGVTIPFPQRDIHIKNQ